MNELNFVGYAQAWEVWVTEPKDFPDDLDQRKYTVFGEEEAFRFAKIMLRNGADSVSLGREPSQEDLTKHYKEDTEDTDEIECNCGKGEVCINCHRTNTFTAPAQRYR